MAIWLVCKKSYRFSGVRRKNRPIVTKINPSVTGFLTAIESVSSERSNRFRFSAARKPDLVAMKCWSQSDSPEDRTRMFRFNGIDIRIPLL
jgi:hypothetical protein